MISRYLDHRGNPYRVVMCWCGHAVSNHGSARCFSCAQDGLTSLAEHGPRVIE